MSVFGRISAGKPARYIFEPARARPSGSLTTITPDCLSRRPNSMAGLKRSPSVSPTWGLLRRKTTSKSLSRASARDAPSATRALANAAGSLRRPGRGRTRSPRTTLSSPCDRPSTETKATSCPRRCAANARCRVVYVGRCVRTLLTTKQTRIGTRSIAPPSPPSTQRGGMAPLLRLGYPEGGDGGRTDQVRLRRWRGSARPALVADLARPRPPRDAPGERRRRARGPAGRAPHGRHGAGRRGRRAADARAAPHGQEQLPHGGSPVRALGPRRPARHRPGRAGPAPR